MQFPECDLVQRFLSSRGPNVSEIAFPACTALLSVYFRRMEFKDLDPAQIEERRAAMIAAIGVWKDRSDLPDTETYIRNLRDDDRLERLHAQWRSDETDGVEER